MTKNIFTIPAGLSFVDALAEELWREVEQDPLTLSEYLILLPNRRAVRNLREAFLRITGGVPVLLPRMQPLGDLEEEELVLGLADHEFDLPPAIPPLRRQVLLARLIQQTEPLAKTFDQAVRLAAELASFLDEVQTAGVDFTALDTLVEEDYSEHWQITLKFLKILTEHWPKILAEQGALDPVDRHNRMVEAQIALWAESPPDFPVIVAGSTGSIPSSRRLIATIAGLPTGRVVLPGLDTALDDDGWAQLGEDHPQYGMKKLLQEMKISRDEITCWPETTPTLRQNLVTETMRPASTTEKWQDAVLDDEACAGLSRIDCATQQEEAETIALMLRSVLEDENKTAALVTSDRHLGKRVAISLQRWGIEIDDSAGLPLSETPVGTWFQLVARCALEDLAPVPLLALLKHPFAKKGPVWQLEKSVLRGPRPASGFTGLKAAVGREDKSLLSWVEKLEATLNPLIQAFKGGSINIAELLPLHVKAAEDLAEETLWQGDDGEMATGFVNELLQVTSDIPALGAKEYTGLVRALMDTRAVRPRYGKHPRLHILGQMEARLMAADLMVVGGLNEGSWPAEAGADPWMSRQMRERFGLIAHEQSIGLAAHDFVQCLAAPQVVLTRAVRVDGTPTVPARWLLRLETLLQAAGREPLTKQKHTWRHWARMLDQPDKVMPLMPPEPRPPVTVRPQEASVTQVERWMRDPYGFYAQKVLGLKKLDPVDADADAATRGTLLHRILEQFVMQHPNDLPDNAEDELLKLGEALFEEESITPEVHAFWWPRFEKMAAQFIQEEIRWRAEAKPLIVETRGETKLDNFTLTAKADRVDRLQDGSLAVLDYKTGGVPSGEDVRQGYAPQLPLEAVITGKGGFPDIDACSVSHMAIWQVSGGNPAVKIESYKKLDVATIANDAEAGLKNLVAVFADEKTPYLATPHRKKPDYNDYEHLARIKEWAVSGGES